MVNAVHVYNRTIRTDLPGGNADSYRQPTRGFMRINESDLLVRHRIDGEHHRRSVAWDCRAAQDEISLTAGTGRVSNRAVVHADRIRSDDRLVYYAVQYYRPLPSRYGLVAMTSA